MKMKFDNNKVKAGIIAILFVVGIGIYTLGIPGIYLPNPPDKAVYNVKVIDNTRQLGGYLDTGIYLKEILEYVEAYDSEVFGKEFKLYTTYYNDPVPLDEKEFYDLTVIFYDEVPLSDNTARYDRWNKEIIIYSKTGFIMDTYPIEWSKQDKTWRSQYWQYDAGTILHQLGHYLGNLDDDECAEPYKSFDGTCKTIMGTSPYKEFPFVI